MQTHSIIECLFLFFLYVGPLQVCGIDITEGISFVIVFDSNEDLITFSKLCAKYEHVTLQLTDIIIDDSEDESEEENTNCCKYGELALKLTMQRYVKHIPLFSSRHALNKNGNKLLKHHIQSIINFVAIRSEDYSQLSIKHNTTVLYSTKSNKSNSFEKLEKAFKTKLQNDSNCFVDLLPISINVQTKQMTSRCYDWQINGCREASNNLLSKELNDEYIEICSLLYDYNGLKLSNTNYRFHTRTIKLNMCMANVTTDMLINSITK